MGSCGIHMRAISEELLKISFLDMTLKITILKFSHISQGQWVNQYEYQDWGQIYLFPKYITQNRPVAQIPQCTSPVSHNVPICSRNVYICAHFCYKMVHYGIFVWCIVGFVKQVYFEFVFLWDGPIQICCLNAIKYKYAFVPNTDRYINSMMISNIGYGECTCSSFWL